MRIPSGDLMGWPRVFLCAVALAVVAVEVTSSALAQGALPAEGAQVAAPSPEEVDVLGATVGYVPAAEFLEFMGDADAGVKGVRLFEGRGPLAILLLVFVGGLALNLTPCVLPMIPINLAVIGAGTKAGSRRRGFMLGGAYGAAMALTYGVLGVVVILTAGSFGALNASPWFNASVAALFVVLGLAMFDAVTIDFSRLSSRIRVGASSRGTFTLAFGMGAIAALLAGACVAPVVLQVVVFSSNLYAGGTTAALMLPFLLGVGMAVPWPLAGAGLAALPRPGAWMVGVKQAFGVVILATAAYYGYEAYGQFSAQPSVAQAPGLSKDGWYHSMPDAFAAARTQNKPVLIDMWATWCKNCVVMDATTFQDAEVKRAMERYVLVKLQAEDPEAQPAKGWMDRLESVGLPTYGIVRLGALAPNR
jgi:thiol:disulfide interchange protein